MSQPIPDDPEAQARLEQILDGRKVSVAAFASNWKSVLVADAAVGLVLVLIGVALVAWVHPWVGWVVIGLGVLYVLLVARRGLQWRYLRGQAGSDG